MLANCEKCGKEEAVALIMRDNPNAKYVISNLDEIPEYYVKEEFHIGLECLSKWVHKGEKIIEVKDDLIILGHKGHGRSHHV